MQICGWCVSRPQHCRQIGCCRVGQLLMDDITAMNLNVSLVYTYWLILDNYNGTLFGLLV